MRSFVHRGKHSNVDDKIKLIYIIHQNNLCYLSFLIDFFTQLMVLIKIFVASFSNNFEISVQV